MTKIELTEEQKAFVASKLADREEMRPLAGDPSLSKRRAGRIARRGVEFLLAFFAVLPLLAIGALLYGINRVQQLLGPGSLDWLSKNDLTEAQEKKLQGNGFGWLTQAVEVYNHKAQIIAAGLTVTVLLIGIILIIEITSKKEEDPHGEEI